MPTPRNNAAIKFPLKTPVEAEVDLIIEETDGDYQSRGANFQVYLRGIFKLLALAVKVLGERKRID